MLLDVIKYALLLLNIKIGKTIKYLGVIEDSNLSFGHHVKRTVEKASRSV